MLQAARHYSVFNPSSYIFTKLDETCRPGVILDQVMDMRLPVSFLTNGQNVPDDLVAATRKKIMGMVFEERRSAA
jgi:flagellar biosynthesis protein FlhF